MVELQDTWSWLPAIYLFFGGLSAGSFLTVALVKVLRPGKFPKTIMGGMWITVGALAIGLLSLISEVEKPFQAMLMPVSFVNPTSWMTIGAWLLLVSFIVFLLNALCATDGVVAWLGKSWKALPEKRDRIARVLAIIGMPLALCVAVYTGILLGAAPAIPLWNTWLLPVLFTISALDTGLAAVLMLAAFVERDAEFEPIRSLAEKVVIGLVVLEGITLVAFIASMQAAGTNQAVSVSILTEGALSVQFWVLVVVVGLLAPLAAAVAQLVIARTRKDEQVMAVLPVAGGTCALVGGFTLRFVVLAAGIHAALVSPVALEAVRGISTFL